MINNCLNDSTQSEIIPVLDITEQLIKKAIRIETGTESLVNITAMSDLGLANNSVRMRGGFYTGMYLEWDSEVPFVPVDATVNSCGVSVFKLKNEISYQEFKYRVENVKKELTNSKYNWNFQRGNHFVSYCETDKGDHCVVMHASADEYKRSIRDYSLYPEKEVWYYDKIRMVETKDGNRYLRYLVNDEAKKFISIAMKLEQINHTRMEYMAELLFGDLLEKEMLYVPHYGMPDRQSIAIGCSWKKDESILLSVPGREIYIIKPNNITDNRKWITPHGLGACADNPQIHYKNNELYINDIRIIDDDDVKNVLGKGIRFADSDKKTFCSNIKKVMEKNNAVIKNKIYPIYSLNAKGFANLKCKKG